MALPLGEGLADSTGDDRLDTWGREELLRMRGYPEDIIAGNGHRESGDGPISRLCAGGCGTVLEGPESKRWCSEGCRQRHRRKGQVAGMGNHPTPFVSEAPAATEPAVPALLDLVAAIPAAMPAGWQLRASAEGVTLRWPAWSD